MVGFGLLMGHLVGDYILQDDWMAANKSLKRPDRCPTASDCSSALMPNAALAVKKKEWERQVRASKCAPLACTIHCLLYTLAVWLFSFWWMPWWGYLICFTVHWPIDRWRLARVFMRWTRHEEFATGVLSPWSIILTDNILHLLTLYLIGAAAGVVK